MLYPYPLACHVQESVYVITPSQPGTLTPGGAGDGGLFVKHLIEGFLQVCEGRGGGGVIPALCLPVSPLLTSCGLNLTARSPMTGYLLRVPLRTSSLT